MLYVIYCVDRPGSVALRERTRATHRTYIDHFQDHIVTSGPMLHDDGVTPAGGLLIVDFPTREDAERFAHEDPYHRAGLFESLIVRRWRQVIPEATDP